MTELRTLAVRQIESVSDRKYSTLRIHVDNDSVVMVICYTKEWTHWDESFCPL